MTSKEIEKLNNDFHTKIRQEFNRFTAETKQVLDGLDDRIDAKVQEQLKFHLEQLHQSLQLIGHKLTKHFGP